ncbi:MAG: PAS domain-containing protein, partial [Methylocystis sp.]|nr:PAS domain-containing protein [Methylocystis sp.]
MNDRDGRVNERELAAAQVRDDPAFAALEASGAPLIAATGDPLRVVYVNDSALAIFGADLDALSKQLFEEGEPGARRLSEVVESVRYGAAPRLERLRLSFGSIAQTVTILCRRTGGDAGPPFFVIAALGLRPAQRRAEAASSLDGDAARDILESASSSDDASVAPASCAQSQTGQVARPARFLWRTDAAGRFANVSAVLAALVGRRYADLIGREIGDVSQSWQLDPDGRLAEALAQRQSWSGVEVKWPVGDHARVPTALGALPIFDETQRFCGFQGYGVLRLDRLEATAPVVTPTPPVQPPSGAEPPNEDQPLGADFLSAKVVPLRPLNSIARDAEATGAPAPADAKAEDDRLTLNEQ